MVLNLNYNEFVVDAEVFVNDKDDLVIENLVVFNEFGEYVPEEHFSKDELEEIYETVLEEAEDRFGQSSTSYVF